MATRYALRPYQVEIGRRILDSIIHHRGLAFSVEIARQGGKNELSAQMEMLLLTLFIQSGGNLVKAAPTFIPQCLISMMRLKERLNDAGFGGFWSSQAGYIIQVGQARQLFFSAENSANVVGATAHILLEIDEAQDVEKEKYYKEFRPMGASTNVTSVLYGTPWNAFSLLEEVKQTNLELERKDGIRRHFSFDWQEVARYNPEYQRYVVAERERLGEDHPLFRTQYMLLPLQGGGGFLSVQQIARMGGFHSRQARPSLGKTYVAGVDIAGQGEEGEGIFSLPGTGSRRGRDSTVVTIAELDFSACEEFVREPAVKVVEHYCWTGESHASLYAQLVDILKSVWRCRRVVVDSTGLGEGVASFLEKALGASVVAPFKFTAQSKSDLAYELLAAVNSGRLKVYGSDGSFEYQEFWRQMELAKAHYRPNKTMNFYVDPSQGHDDFMMSLALVVKASGYLPRVAVGRLRD
ncbi:MAG: hypothetical protein HY666_01095 [Chloroflexi bacterium]|nr:hypothetical protein [Chloroflexota bacterium]